jgi:hypothetical protein
VYNCSPVGPCGVRGIPRCVYPDIVAQYTPPSSVLDVGYAVCPNVALDNFIELVPALNTSPAVAGATG